MKRSGRQRLIFFLKRLERIASENFRNAPRRSLGNGFKVRVTDAIIINCHAKIICNCRAKSMSVSSNLKVPSSLSLLKKKIKLIKLNQFDND